MARVIGNVNLVIGTKVENTEESMALMEANYMFDKDRFVAYVLYAIDGNGNRVNIPVYDCESISLEHFVE